MTETRDSALYWHYLRFQIECLRRRGTAFQEFFQDVMLKADPSFQVVKPWGQEGDRKCDGVLPVTGTFFQVYAPEGLSAAETVSKIEEDFRGAKAHWPELRRWVFVWSGVDVGLPPSAVAKLSQLRADPASSAIVIEDWSTERLWVEVLNLTPQQRVELLGPAPLVAGVQPRLQAPMGRASELTLEALGVDAVDPKVLDRALVTSGSQLQYVCRGEVDERLREHLQRARDGAGPVLVCVYGPSKAGKSRSMLEAVRAQLPDAAIVAPEPSRAVMQAVLDHRLLQSAGESLDQGTVVLWLDDIEAVARVESEGLGWVQLLDLKREIPTLVVAATAGGRGLSARTADERAEIAEPVRALLDRGAKEYLLAELTSDGERAALQEVVSADLAIEMYLGLGEVAVSGPELLDTLVRKRHMRVMGGSLCDEGAAVAWAAVTAFRLGITEPIPESFLRQLFDCFVSNGDDTRFQIGLDWATQAIHGHVALLRRRGSLGFLPYDYVVQNAPERDDDATRCSGTKILDAVATDDLVLLGVTASRNGRADFAGEAFRRAERSGSAEGSLMLGVWLEHIGEQDGANAVWARAHERGNPEGTARLGRASLARGDLAEAEYLFRDAAARGHPEAAVSLGKMLLEVGDLAGAESAWRRADEHGSASGARNLAVFLRDERHDDPGSEAAWIRADVRGDADAALTLGLIYRNRGDRKAAEAAFRRGDARGSPDASLMLGNVLFERGDPAEAEQAWRRADERGNGGGAFGVGNTLRDRGDIEGALDAWRRAEARGNEQASFAIGRHLEDAGESADAEAAFQRSADLGSSDAANHLGFLLNARGEYQEAEAAFQRAVELGSAKAMFNLGVLYLNEGRVSQARLSFDQAAQADDPEVAAGAVKARHDLDEQS